VRSGRFLALAGSGLILFALVWAGLATPATDIFAEFVAVALAQGGVYLIAVWLAWSLGPSRWTMVLILGIAVAMRIVVVLAPPVLSNDIYRYVWDGRVAGVGINPYRYIPDDPHLAPLRDAEIFPEINRRHYARTIYPPAAQAVFFAVTRISESLTAMKMAMVLFEAVAVALLLQLLAASGRQLSRIVVYAWHPLPLWEFAGSGHIDAAAIAFIALALWSTRLRTQVPTKIEIVIPGLGPGIHEPLVDAHGSSPWAKGPRAKPGHDRRGELTKTLLSPWLGGLALAAAALVKFYPAVLFPALWRRWDWRMPLGFAGALILAYLPFLGVGWHALGFLPQYFAEEGFAAGGAGFYLWSLAKSLPPLRGLPDAAYPAIAALVMAALAIRVALRHTGPDADIRGAALLAGAFTLLLSPHYAWYFAWLIPFACLVPSLSLLWLTVASFLLYLVPVGSQLVRGHERLVVESVLYVPFVALAAIDLWRHRRREPPGAAQA
jgi:alpha-1,6-mannosyltransferase